MSEKEISKKMKEIMSRIKSRREELGMSYQALSEKVGISKSTLQRYETGYIKNMPIDKLEEIANALNVSPAYLMGWDAQEERLSAYYLALSKHEDLLISEYRKLNNMGKLKVLQLVQEMTCSPLYNNKYLEELKSVSSHSDINIIDFSDNDKR